MANNKPCQVVADEFCFACGQKNPIGLRANFEIDLAACTSYASVRIAPEYQGWQDVVHGGVVATLLDEACIYACRTRAERCLTAEIQIRYRKPVPVGASVELFGRIIDSGRKVWHAEAQLKIDGALFAEAQAKIFILATEGAPPSC